MKKKKKKIIRIELSLITELFELEIIYSQSQTLTLTPNDVNVKKKNQPRKEKYTMVQVRQTGVNLSKHSLKLSA